jgi:hypothetical protein
MKNSFLILGHLLSNFNCFFFVDISLLLEHEIKWKLDGRKLEECYVVVAFHVWSQIKLRHTSCAIAFQRTIFNNSIVKVEFLHFQKSFHNSRNAMRNALFRWTNWNAKWIYGLWFIKSFIRIVINCELRRCRDRWQDEISCRALVSAQHELENVGTFISRVAMLRSAR